jgi:hypothetical protein
VNIDKEFPHKFLRASDLAGAGTQRVFIERVSREEMFHRQTNQQRYRPVLRFIDKQMALVLNVTNAMTIRDCYGPETDDWVMKPLDLHVERMHNGENGIVVTVPLPAPERDDGNQEREDPEADRPDEAGPEESRRGPERDDGGGQDEAGDGSEGDD